MMNHNYDIKHYFSFIIPSILAFTILGVYSVVDGFFVGNALGDAGVSAINVVFPAVALSFALGSGVGLGGAVIWSIETGRGNYEKVYNSLKVALILLVILSIIITIVPFVWMDEILHILGARGEVASLGRIYLWYMFGTAIIQLSGSVLVPFVRNNGGVAFATNFMILGFVMNIVLDYLLIMVFPFGIHGAAIATILSQAVTIVGCIYYLIKHQMLKFSKPVNVLKTSFKIIKIGIAPFGINMSPMVSIFLMNRNSLFYGGPLAVSTISCIEFILSFVYCVLQGVGAGAQPLMSKFYGERKFTDYAITRRLSLYTALFLSAVSIVVIYCARGHLGNLFGTSDEAALEIAIATPVFLVGMFFYAYSRICSSAFYSTERETCSYACIYAEPILLLILLQIIPRYYDLPGVWWCMVLSQVIAACISFYLSRKTHVKSAKQA